ncbi:alpha/beta hydrolase [Bradyrhizobium tropiciagri]|uniref:alpha/beta fold hydrolase n=1 Tax=Bradyrhizobium tropiciagri TaxID=312253 RepID=UPI001BA94270|nr:alpha/beta hydrolase family protein [Bradyrhizobium tropiciagri]MBR0869434.1 alpha/beta hydrolase [Bradyrhizobium tropiciagri]
MSAKMTRRDAIAAGVGAVAVTSNVSAAMAASPGKTFVLVHGAWHGGWCWRPVADLLEAQGHKVFTPTLSGLGERSHLLTREVNVSTHVVDVANVIAWEDLQDVVLVGHSYGGLAISGVADKMADRISSIIFLDAFLPEDGDSLLEKSSPAFKSAIEAALGRQDPSFKAPPAAAFGVQDEKDRAWVDSKTTPQPIGTYTEKLRVLGGREKIAKKTYIRAKGYASPTFDGNVAKLKDKTGWKLVELQTGHDVMVIAPKDLAKLLIELS